LFLGQSERHRQAAGALETPPMSLGVIDDMWFPWVTDFGLPQ
jgi:hypothetical protein